MTICMPSAAVISVLAESQLWAAQEKRKIDQIRWLPLMRHSNNQVWRATCKTDQAPGFDVVIKLYQGQTSSSVHQGIFNQRLAGHHGLAPAVLEADPVRGSVICSFLPGGTLKPSQLENPDILERTVKALRRLHDIDGSFQHQHHYLPVLRKREEKALSLMGDRTINRISDLQNIAAAASRCLEATAVPSRPCHSDMVTHNIVLTGKGRVMFVDWDVSGMGDPHEELANLLWSASLSPSRLAPAMASYFSASDAHAQARVLLYLMLIPYDWVMRYQIAAQEPAAAQDHIKALAKRQRRRLREAVEFSRSVLFTEAMTRLQSVAARD